MKLTGLTTRLLAVDPTPRYGGKPVPAGRPQTWHFPLVALHTDEGLTGYSMGYGPHGDGYAFASLLHGVFYNDLMGKDVAYHESLWAGLKEKHRHLYNLSQAALGVLDVALWDLRGKAVGLPIAKLLGLARDKVPSYATSWGVGLSSEEVFEEARAMQKRGFHGYKLQLRDGPSRDIPRFEAAREAVGAHFPLMQDAVAGYSFVEALEVGRTLERLRYRWFEEPISDRHLEQLKTLRKTLTIPILATETVSLDELHLYLAQGATDLARGDVLIKGGVTGLRKAFALCELWGAGLEIHAANAPLLDVANLHVACSVMNGDIETHHPVFRFGLKNSPLEVDAEGYLHLPDAPGLGVDLDWDWIEDHTADMLEGTPDA